MEELRNVKPAVNISDRLTKHIGNGNRSGRLTLIHHPRNLCFNRFLRPCTLSEVYIVCTSSAMVYYRFSLTYEEVAVGQREMKISEREKNNMELSPKDV